MNERALLHGLSGRCRNVSERRTEWGSVERSVPGYGTRLKGRTRNEGELLPGVDVPVNARLNQAEV